jgi:surface polysaccharide O-acyltransferase-like enzyme
MYVCNKPLVYLLSDFGDVCVPIYLFLSGYGLFSSFVSNKYKNPFSRVISLWLNFIIILIVFVSIGSFIRPDIYPQNAKMLFLNILTWRYTYNPHWWFLFPYFMLVLTSKLLFKIINRYRSLLVFIAIAIMWFISQVIITQYREWLYQHYFFYRMIFYFSVLFSFSIGALFAKEAIFHKIRSHFSNRILSFIAPLIIMGIIVINMFYPTDIFNPIFAVVFIVCFIMMKVPDCIAKILRYLGHHSTNIWLIHAFFYMYIFHDFIYSFKFPIVIYCVLLLLSILSSYIINFIYTPLNKIIYKNTLK